MQKEVVIIMGYPASGKTTLVKHFEAQGYVRLNRDDAGGSLADLNNKLAAQMKSGVALFVLDNTYGTIEKRKPIIDLCKQYGYQSTCVWLDTSPEDAQWNSSSRIVNSIHGFGTDNTIKLSRNAFEMLGPKLGGIVNTDAIPAAAIFAYKKRFEKPTKAEGWDELIKHKFVRQPIDGYIGKAVILDYDDTLRKTKSGDKFPCHPDDVEILPNRAEKLQEMIAEGYLLLGCSNQSGIEKGKLSMETAKACFQRTNDLLGVSIDVQFCPHHSFPIRCYCRKPLPGIPVYLIHKYRLDREKCLFVGDMTSDKTCARRSGIEYQHADEFFKE